jgi:serine/threonine-protein kinase
LTEDGLQTVRAALGGRFEVERELGRGGMAVVYLARDSASGRQVAIKVVTQELGAVFATDRFQREIKVAASLSHPHIVPMLESGSAGPLHYYTMPYIDGESLRARIDRTGQQPIDDVLRLGRDIAGALQYAHDRGIVHRDVKPENILFQSGEAVILDFGIARAIAAASDDQPAMTSTGVVVGTPRYMSPEQAGGERTLDGRSDIYSLGCVLYEALAGHEPFSGRSAQAVIARHALDTAPSISTVRPSAPPALEAALFKALAKSPADRFASAADFAAALEEIQRSGTTPEFEMRTRRAAAAAGGPSRARRFAIAAGAFVLLLAVAAYGVRAWRSGSAPASGRISLAVLTMSSVGLADDEHFGTGLADEITTRLARLPGVAVTSRTSALYYKTEGKSAKQIGKDLGVDYLLGGSLKWQTSADGTRRVRVTPTLVRVSDAVEVWSESLEGTMDDVFALQARISEQFAAALSIHLAEADRKMLRTPATANVAAYDEYLLGRVEWTKRTPEALTLAVQHFNRAVAMDPTFAKAYAALASSYVLYSQYGVSSLPLESAFRLAREAATRALGLDPKLSSARAALSEVFMYADRDWARAADGFKAAIALDADDATAHQWYSELLLITGRGEEAMAEGERAATLDPLAPMPNHAYASGLLLQHRFREALDKYHFVLELDPANRYARFGFLWAFIGLKSLDSAMAAAAPLGFSKELSQAWLRGTIDATARPAARAALRRDSVAMKRLPLEIQAQIYASVDDRDAAFGILDRMAAGRLPAPPGVQAIPLYDPIRGDPRYGPLLKRMNFR